MRNQKSIVGRPISLTIEEIAGGESKNIEFKTMLPQDSERYIKTIIAFANTQGGKLVIGIDDRTREVAGVEDDILFQTMDSISNAVSDACSPQIVPNVEPQTVDGRTVIVVAVAPGPNRPYYLKSKGKERGTYIRVAGTSRPAHPDKIKELEMEGARISWDELVCVGYPVTEEAVEKLCGDIMDYRQRAGLPQRRMTKTQLVNWKLLKETDGSYMASNAFVLLTSDYFPFSKTQCAVFKGTERNVFLDKREFTGPIYGQIEDAVNFVLRNIRLGATIEGLLRKESYELPTEAIREMIINAHCHRCLTDDSCIQVAVYDDRLEVTSPGGLYNGLTYEEALNGHSRLRNRGIANVFNQMGLIEAWGTGIKRIIHLSGEYCLPVPEIQAFDSMFRVNLYRSSARSTYDYGPVKHSENISEFTANSEKPDKNMAGTDDISVKYGENAAGFGGDSIRSGENTGRFSEDTAKYGEDTARLGRNLMRFGENLVKFGEKTADFGEDSIKFGEDTAKYDKNSVIYGAGSAELRKYMRVEEVGRYGENESEASVKALCKPGGDNLNETQRKILIMIKQDNRISAAIMAKGLNISTRAVEKNIKKLRETGILVRHGSARGGYWEIMG